MLGLARSSYFYHRARLLVADKYAAARGVIANIFELNHRCYGHRRIHAALGRQQVFISETVVRRLMRQEGLAAAITMATSLRLVRRGNRSCAGAPRQSGLSCGRTAQKMAHRHYRIRDPGRQGLSVAGDRLLRRSCRELDNQHATGR